MTSIFNDAERGKAAYNVLLNDLNASSLSDTKVETKENMKTDQSKTVNFVTNVKPEDNIDDLEKDLDFLLSLKEPVQSTVIGIPQSVIGIPLSMSHNTGKILTLKQYFIVSFNVVLFSGYFILKTMRLNFHFRKNNCKCAICNQTNFLQSNKYEGFMS